MTEELPATGEAVTSGPVVHAVRADLGAGELEVHLRAAALRTIGRARLDDGLRGAVTATLDALGPHRPGASWTPTVVATRATTADGSFRAEVELRPGTGGAPRRGTGTGPNPLVAAARAALDAAGGTGVA